MDELAGLKAIENGVHEAYLDRQSDRGSCTGATWWNAPRVLAAQSEPALPPLLLPAYRGSAPLWRHADTAVPSQGQKCYPMG